MTARPPKFGTEIGPPKAKSGWRLQQHLYIEKSRFRNSIAQIPSQMSFDTSLGAAESGAKRGQRYDCGNFLRGSKT